MLGTPSIRVIAAKGNTHNIIIVYKIIFDSDIAAVFTFMLACNFDPNVAVMYYISFNNNICAAINVNTISTSVSRVGRISRGIDVVYLVSATDSVAYSVKGNNTTYTYSAQLN